MIALAGSQILYHIIDLKNAVTAMRDNKFHLTPVVGTGDLDFEAKLSDGKPHFFLSLTRSRTNDYFKRNSYGANKVIFVLDGQKMNANYKIKPVNYWHANQTTKDDEMEDRLFASKRTIPCLKYIKEIHFYANSNISSSGNQSLSLAMLAKTNKIPLYQYENMADLMKMDKRNTVKLSVVNPKPTPISKRDKAPSKYALYTGRAEAWWDFIRFPDDPSVDPYEAFVESVKNDPQRYKNRKAVFDVLQYASGPSGAENAVNDFKNDLGARYDELSSKYVEKITKYMRRHHFDARKLMDSLIRKRKAHAEYKRMQAEEDARKKFPLKPTFYIYKNEDGSYRLEVENYPEWNATSNDVYELEDIAYKFHRESKNLWGKFGNRIERMF
jgi:hypothetical protein